MNETERVLFEGALKSVKTLVLDGLLSSEAQVLETIGKIRGGFESLDLRKPGAGNDGAALKVQVKQQLSQQSTLVVLLPAAIPEGAREVLAELTAGGLKIDPNAPEPVKDEVRVIALSPDKVLDEKTARLFGLQISGMRVIDEQRAAIRRAEEELKAAQARARESSRRHGLA